MTHSFARKKGKMYRYYVCMNALKNGYAACPLKTLPAGDVEQMVMDRMRKVFGSPTIVAQTYREAQASTTRATNGFTERYVMDALARVDELWDNLFPAEQARIAQLLVERVVATRDSLEVELRPEGMLSLTAEMNSAEENGDGQSAVR